MVFWEKELGEVLLVPRTTTDVMCHMKKKLYQTTAHP
jgi:hypothetical protein